MIDSTLIHSQIDLVTRVDMYVWQVCFRGPPSHVRREKDLKATDEEIRDQSRIPKCEEWWKPHVGRTREKERRQSLHLAISLPSLDPWPQCTRSRDHVLFLAANGTDRRDPRAHADEWTARYIIKRPSDPLSEEEKRSRIFVEKKKRPRQKRSYRGALKEVVCSRYFVNFKYGSSEYVLVSSFQLISWRYFSSVWC